MSSPRKDTILCQSGFLIFKIYKLMFIGCTVKALTKHTKTVCTAESYLCNPCSPHQADKQVYHVSRT